MTQAYVMLPRAPAKGRNTAAHLGNFFPHTVHSCILLFLRFFFEGSVMSMLSPQCASGNASGMRGALGPADPGPLVCASESLPPKCKSVSDVCAWLELLVESVDAGSAVSGRDRACPK